MLTGTSDSANCVGSVPWARLERVGDHHPLDQNALGSLGFFVLDWCGWWPGKAC